nr:PIG-L family deacetylase [Marinicella sp. W31]MDC2877488.1 PIG-L family deacetylase [Marinicella sp. W31]
MLTSRQRIEQEKASSSLVRLHRALSRLKSPLTMMNTGAHPDDEQSDMLAWFRFGLGMRVIIGCSTRGEGGQNVLGPERIGALGVLRTREMEEAARALDADIHWLGHGPDDPVHDFGFSKDGDATFARWGEDRIVERMVRAYRRERPDIVIPTFLDVPGQHGHHRAMTRAAETAIRLAADETAYPEHFAEGLKPWRVAKYYLPAWSGGGGTYDDDLPPPPATVTVVSEGRDPATGADYGRIGEWSRYYHASQGMGWWPERPDHAWELHLLIGLDGGAHENTILDGLPTTLASLCSDEATSLVKHLVTADAAIAAAIDAFPDREAITRSLISASGEIEAAVEAAPAAFVEAHGHRLSRKLIEIDAAILETEALFERAYGEAECLTPGGSTVLAVVLSEDTNRTVTVNPILSEGVTASPPSEEAGIIRFTLSAAADAPLTGQYPPLWSSLGGNAPVSITLETEVGGRKVTGHFDLETALPVIPAHSLALSPNAFIVPVQRLGTNLSFAAQTEDPNLRINFRTPDGYQIKVNGEQCALSLPKKPLPGLVTLTPEIDDQPAYNVTPFSTLISAAIASSGQRL